MYVYMYCLILVFSRLMFYLFWGGVFVYVDLEEFDFFV